jgi:hypothetical protein
MIGSDRAAELADRFEALHGETLAFAEGCTDAAWSAVTAGEGWPVGTVVSHIAEGYAAVDGWARGYLEGRPIEETRALIDEANAKHAAAMASAPRGQVLAKLRDNAARVTATVRDLTDEQLAISLPMRVVDGAPVTTEQVVETLLRHTTRHLGSCREAAGA